MKSHRASLLRGFPRHFLKIGKKTHLFEFLYNIGKALKNEVEKKTARHSACLGERRKDGRPLIDKDSF